jgi:dynactin complex subunit
VRTPTLTIPEYRAEFIRLTEENMRLRRHIVQLEKSLEEENRRRTALALELVNQRKSERMGAEVNA